MTDEQVSLVCNANPTNRYICKHLDEKTLNLCKAMLSKLDAGEFKEINPDAEFDITCLPIPIESIKNGENFHDELLQENLSAKNLLDSYHRANPSEFLTKSKISFVQKSAIAQFS